MSDAEKFARIIHRAAQDADSAASVREILDAAIDEAIAETVGKGATSDAKYIFVFESGEIKYATAIGADDLESVECGYLEIIDIASDVPRFYSEGGWTELESADG